MGRKSVVRAALVATLLVVAAGAAAECISGIAAVSQNGQKPNRVAGPIAWSGAVLGVAKDEPANKDAVYVAIYDESFHQLTPDTLVAADTFDGAHHLFWTGSEFGLFYLDKSKRLILQRFAESGALIGGPVRVTPEVAFYASDEIDVVWSAARGAYVVIHRITQGPGVGLYLGLVEPNGTTRFNQLANISPADPARPLAVAADNGVVGMFFTHQKGTLNLTRMPLDDRPRSSVPIADDPGERIVVGAHDGVFGIARSLKTDADTTEIHWMVVDTDGVPVVDDALLITGSGIDVAPLSLLYANGEWALVYADSKKGFLDNPGKLRLRRFTEAGTTISDSPFSIDLLRENALTQFELVWTGNSHIVSGARTPVANGTDSYLLRRCPVVAEIFAADRYVRRDEVALFTSEVSGGQPGYAYRWDFGDFTVAGNKPAEEHRYKKVGTYTITLTVTDSTGATGKTTYTLYVMEPKQRSVRK